MDRHVDRVTSESCGSENDVFNFDANQVPARVVERVKESGPRPQTFNLQPLKIEVSQILKSHRPFQAPRTATLPTPEAPVILKSVFF